MKPSTTNSLSVPVSRADLEAARALWVKVAKDNGWHTPGHFGVTLWVRPDGSVQDSLYQAPEHRGHDTIVVVDIRDDSEDTLAVIELHDDKIVLHAPKA